MRMSLALFLLVTLFTAASADRDRHPSRRWHRPEPQPVYLPPPAPVAATAGAIAYSPSTGLVGWSYGQPDQDTARWAAVNACGQSDCEWKVSEQGAFAVLVLGSGGAIYWSWDTSLAAAQQSTLQLCSANTTGCYVTRWVSN
jgi:serine/threonine-protein kinase